MIKFLAKRLLPFIATQIDLDIDTIVKKQGVFLRIRIEAFNFTLLDRLVPIAEKQEFDPKKQGVDLYLPAPARDLPESVKDSLNADREKRAFNS